MSAGPDPRDPAVPPVPLDPPVRTIDPADPAGWAQALHEAAAQLDAGRVVLLPAEGLYGYHVRPDRPDALRRLLDLKPRGMERGWILLLGDAASLERWDVTLPVVAIERAARHWPGPLTIVLPAASFVPEAVRADDGTVAVRCPGNRFLREVVRSAGGLLVSTSANRPGAPAPARLEDAARAGVALAIDAGPLSGIPSTLIRVDGSTIHVLRKGAIDLAALGGDRT